MRHRFTTSDPGSLDEIIAAATPLSREEARALVESGHVRVDGSIARVPTSPMSRGAQIEVRTRPRGAVPAGIVERYRDDDVLVVDKPAGLPSQPTRNRNEPDLYGILSDQEPYVGLHHRLDTPTSGLILLTVNRRANAAIAAGFADGTTRRTYQLVVVGDPGPEGLWDAPIDDRPARTRWTRLSSGGGMSVLSATLETGRTHQIRIHATGAGHPVVGDRRHGGAAARLWPRLALHAIELCFAHPTRDETLTVSAPVPPDLTDLWRTAGSEPPSDAS